jgi:hypothetical protein
MFKQAYTVSKTYIQDNLESSFKLPLLFLILFFSSFLLSVLQLNYNSASDTPIASYIWQDRFRSDRSFHTATITQQHSPNVFREVAEDTMQLLERAKNFN